MGTQGHATGPRVMVSALVALCCLLASACAMPAPAQSPAHPVAGGHPPILTPPTATPTISPETLRDAALGCAPAAPKPQAQLVFQATPPNATNAPPNEVALTFDDGPTAQTTPPFLDYLERTHTAATFFVEGQYAQMWPDLIRREWQDGFAIGVHTWDHPDMLQQTVPQMHHQLGDTLKTLHAILGADACIWLWRPPYGDYNALVMQVAASYGLTTVNWDDSGLDWTQPGTQQIADMILQLIHPGSVVLMHDGPAQREQTLAALPLVLAGLKARGLTPVTLPKLLADGGWSGVHVATLAV